MLAVRTIQISTVGARPSLGWKHLETIKALRQRPRPFNCFSVFGYHNEAHTPVEEIIH